MTALAMRSAGAINAVSQLHGEVTRKMFAPLWPELRGRRPAGRRDHQRRPRADVGLGELGRLFERHLSPAWREQYRGPAVLGRASSRFRTRISGPRASALRAYLFQFIRERARQRWTDDHAGAARVVAGGAMLDPHGADDRLRAPLHRLQAAGPALPRRRPARAPRQRRTAVRCSSCSPARRIRPMKPASIICRPSSAHALDPQIRRPHRVRRRLRPARRAPARAGLRRLAQHAAQTASKPAARAA